MAVPLERGDVNGHDGYSLHANPDGSWLFLEGHRPANNSVLSREEAIKLNSLPGARDNAYFGYWDDE